MSARLAWTVRRNAYFDSIDLMQIAEQARQLGGVIDVAGVMGTVSGRSMLEEAGMWSSEAPAAGPSDLLVAVRAESDTVAHRALARVEELLSARRDGEPARDDMMPRTIGAAARRAAPASIAVVAVPGSYAALEAQQALSAGLHVFLFSDGVSLDDEAALKRRARGRGLLVMGPECGTSIINGVGFGFANRVRRGPIGVVGASGTGIQEVTTLVHRLGGGVSHAIGTGGRDLHAAVGGVTTLQGLERLAADESTRALLIVSKPSSRDVADHVLAAAARMGKPAVACLLGYDGQIPKGLEVVRTLEEAAITAVRLTGAAPRGLDRPVITSSGTGGSIIGLYTGGTLCEEARRLVGGRVHRFVDFGAEEYTRGRPHPIIDPSLRHTAIVDAAGDGRASVIVLDVILGDCAHPDPAGALAPVLVDAC